MRFTRFQVKRFGPHRDLDLEFDPRIVLIFGKNESGKSSIRGAIETVLYGFDPATRDSHPLAQWSEGEGGDLHIEADYLFDDGSEQRIERLLQASGKSRTAAAGAAFEGPRGKNKALRFAEDLPRTLYRSIYSIEIEQLAKLATSEQSHVDDLLLPESQSLGLLPISDVRNAVQSDLAAIWRPQKRGSFRILEIRKALDAAHDRLRESESEEAQLRGAMEEQGALETAVVADRGTKKQLDQIDRDAPYLGAVFELRQRERTYGDPIDLSGLGDEFPLVDPEDVEQQATELEDDLEAPRARLESEPLELEAAHLHVLEAAAEVRAAELAIGTHTESRRSAAMSADAVKRLRSDAARELDGALAEPSGGTLLAELGRLPIAQLQSAQEQWSVAWEAHATAPPPVAPRPPVWTLCLAASSASAAIVALLPELPAWVPPIPIWLAPVGVVLTLVSAVAAFFLRAQSAEETVPPERPGTVDELLDAFPVAPAMLESPSGLARWIESATRGRQQLANAESADAEAQRLSNAVDDELTTWRATCEKLDIPSHGDGAVLVERMRSALEHATVAQRRVRDDDTERRTAKTQIDAKQPILDRHRAHFAALGKTLRSNLPDATDLHAAYVELLARRDEQEYLRKRRAELARDSRWQTFRDDPRVGSESAPDDAPWNEDVTNERRAKLAELDDSIEAAVRRLTELGELLGNDSGSRSAKARDVVEELDEQLAAARIERDRLALLDSVLAHAEQRFRKEHQPDVLRRASAYLERVTRGRYSRLDYLEGDDAGLFVTCSERSEPVKVAEPISRGTRDQIFLCLRLGLLDHLDADRERLPLILDDALLRMDDERRPEVYSLLNEVARTRQVFFLTCHRAIADEAEKQLATASIDLGDE